MFREHTEALRLIAAHLNEAKLEWALGGSALLAWHGLTESVNDLDLLVSVRDAAQAHEVLKALGTSSVMAPKEPYCTAYYTRYSIAGTGVDMMGLFSIRHDEGVYRLDWRADEQGEAVRIPVGQAGEAVEVPLSSLEDWYVLYRLLPGRSDKAELIERYWQKSGGPKPERLRPALARELPDLQRRHIRRLLGEN
ncbi:nucleotidyltransferase family protein [Paenibacillus puerhi]|uniref:hypothetical protein n=1 Tax=Paenibacillus puerhi TaxID=2692622 RepID=UPI001359F135|nr:hypothetical protein [Paenibacillus puerhi]